ncbi:10522_t:CDS:1 [Racocetra fulgida]|uniref:10522_t:CDS:1 n=1 Tax=Racocetra fulgida TaxID=60492 RepID=A0A9N9FUI9_9GLOM|nr:10522_t:CDS:1 [Racocetra fulgida]
MKGLFNKPEAIIYTENSDAVVEVNDYIFYKEVKYTIDEFLKNIQEEINFQKKESREFVDYLSHEHENIDESIRNLLRCLEDEIFERDCGVCCIDGVRVDASSQNLCRNSFGFQIRAGYNNFVKSQ